MTSIPANTTIEARIGRWARGQKRYDTAFRLGTTFFALLVLVLLGGVIVALVEGAAPALAKFKLGFIVTEEWNPVTDEFGALAPIYGTLITSAIAMAICVGMLLSLTREHAGLREVV